MKRIILFLITNLAVMFLMMVVFHVVCAFMGVDPSGAMGGDLTALAIFSLIFGMAGGIISLLLSKTIAKWSVGAQVIDGTEVTVERDAKETLLHIGCPDATDVIDLEMTDG